MTKACLQQTLPYHTRPCSGAATIHKVFLPVIIENSRLVVVDKLLLQRIIIVYRREAYKGYNPGR